jgi:hypothetical protein
MRPINLLPFAALQNFNFHFFAAPALGKNISFKYFISLSNQTVYHQVKIIYKPSIFIIYHRILLPYRNVELYLTIDQSTF